MLLGRLPRLAAGKERASHCSGGVAQETLHRLGDLGEGLVMNRQASFCARVHRKPQDLLLLVLEVEVLITHCNIALGLGGVPLSLEDWQVVHAAPSVREGSCFLPEAGRVSPRHPVPEQWGSPLLLEFHGQQTQHCT